LAERLAGYAGRHDVVVLALPRGGVPVAYEVATALSAPLDVFLVRKLGLPGHEEMAMGAIASGGIEVLHQHPIEYLGITRQQIDQVIARERENLRRAAQAFVGDRAPVPVTDRTVILIDDGLATGATMEAAVTALRTQSPAEIVIAVPVGPADTCERFKTLANEVICLLSPRNFRAVGEWYDDFDPTGDEDVKALLAAKI
jgi:predicted phosphoribosyltransferase